MAVSETIQLVARQMGATILVQGVDGEVLGYVTPDLARWSVLRRESIPVARNAIRMRAGGEDWHAARRAAGAAWLVAEAEAMETRQQTQTEAILEAHGMTEETGLDAAGSIIRGGRSQRRVAHGWGAAPVGATGDIAGWAWSLARFCVRGRNRA
jgi:hypothetical protein